ncbi:hypothetical protein Q0590_36665 [Rhodocytophaga aerolata]|uniref:Uncharacterized protein n=1 Tax=Rhodocytophaga aerolata TaxID=455078 RepID=A0ABT8RIF1_9BACT|nr:hypothetical protein [Rhodocytophaga aerolata]MDO1451860.1 hypothetical protein [Rhodocytophaga aerolata]
MAAWAFDSLWGIEMNSYNKYLRLEVIWKDEDMLELKVSVNNGRYSGITEVYDQKELLADFANRLLGFPKGEEILLHSAGEKNSYAYFEMRFYQLDPTGKIGVQITLEENVATKYRESEKDKLILELIVEPSAIDKFQKALIRLAEVEEGVAELIGIEQ